jgi:hypothetical protein
MSVITIRRPLLALSRSRIPDYEHGAASFFCLRYSRIIRLMGSNSQ